MGLILKRASRGLDAGNESRAQHHRGRQADPGNDQHDIV